MPSVRALLLFTPEPLCQCGSLGFQTDVPRPRTLDGAARLRVAAETTRAEFRQKPADPTAIQKIILEEPFRGADPTDGSSSRMGPAIPHAQLAAV